MYAYASELVTANIHWPSHLFFYGRHSTFVLNKKVKRFFARNFTFFFEINVPFYLLTWNDGLYDFVLFVLYSKQEIPKRAVQHRKFWCFNVPVVYFNLLFLLLFGTFWRTLGRSHTWSKIRQDLCQVKVESWKFGPKVNQEVKVRYSNSRFSTWTIGLDLFLRRC